MRNNPADTAVDSFLQEVFLTQHHLGIAMEFVEGGDLAQYVQEHRMPGVRSDRCLSPC